MLVTGEPRPAAQPFGSTLVVTGHLAPAQGGVETFTEQLTRRLPSQGLVVMAPQAPAAELVDRDLPFDVIRYPGRMVQSPASVAAAVLRVVRQNGCEVAWLTSAMPLGLLAVPLRRAGVRRIVVSTHGMEAGFASVPPMAAVMRAIARDVDMVTHLGDGMLSRLSPALPKGVETTRLTGGVDVERFSPAPAAVAAVRDRLALGDRPVVVTASRLVPRKGQDVLIRAWPAIRRRHPDACLLVIGTGRRHRALSRLADYSGVAGDVVFAGSVPDSMLPAYLGIGSVFALPCRDVWAGLQVEGLGLSILEASAVGLPVVVGRSGGSPQALVDGETGHLVDGTSVAEVADAVVGLLDNPAAARAMGAAGRDWVARNWGWDELAGRLRAALDPTSVGAAAW